MGKEANVLPRVVLNVIGAVLTIASVLSATAQTSSVAQPEAQVTFYSHKITALGGIPGHDPAAFKGRIFDQDNQLTFMEPGHFVSFQMATGPHTFSATWWTSKHANSGAHVLLDLVAGKHYFVETGILNSGLLLGRSTLFIKEVTCEGALQDNLHSKPLEPTHLRPSGVPLAVSATAFPQCP